MVDISNLSQLPRPASDALIMGAESGNAAFPSLYPYSNLGATVSNVKAYGAIADKKTVSGVASITSGKNLLTFASGNFTAADVGKSISISGAGAAGVALVTTISQFVSSSQVQLAANASTTINNSNSIVTWGTDNTAAIQAAIDSVKQFNAAFNPQLNNRGGAVYIPTGEYLITNTINLRAGVTLQGAGRQASMLCYNKTTGDGIKFDDVVAGGAIPVVLQDFGIYVPQSITGVSGGHTDGKGINLTGRTTRATFSGYISGTTLYVTNLISGTITKGDLIEATGIAPYTYIGDPVAGQSDQYTVNISQTVGSVGSPVSMVSGFAGGINPVLSRLEVDWFYEGVFMDWCYPAKLTDVVAGNNTQYGFKNTGYCTSTSFNNCYAAATKSGPGFLLNGNYTSLNSCASDSNSTNGYEFYYDKGFANDLSLIACGTEGCANSGIVADRVVGLSIISPRIAVAAGGSHGIQLLGCTGTTIISPVISCAATNSNFGIYQATSNAIAPTSTTLTGMPSLFGGYGSNLFGDPDLAGVFGFGRSSSTGSFWNGYYRFGSNTYETAGLANFHFGGPMQAGSGGTSYGANFRVEATNASITTAISQNFLPVANKSLSRLVSGWNISSPLVNTGTITRTAGGQIADIVGTAINATSGVGNVNLFLGTLGANLFPVNYNYNIFSISRRETYFAGNLRLGNQTSNPTTSPPNGPLILVGYGDPTSGATFTGSISTVSGVPTLTTTGTVGTIQIGNTLAGAGVPGGMTIIAQTAGTTGGDGTYTLNNTLSSTITSVSMTAQYSAPIGSLFLRMDGGGATTLYVKQSGTDNTGWAGK